MIESSHPPGRSLSTGHSLADKHNLRYSLKQYEEYLHHIWVHNLDNGKGKQEAEESKFFKYLRDEKILTEKKQLDEMFKQCIFVKKGEDIEVGQTVPLTLY